MISILITRYQEPWDICKGMFDSIAMQRGIDFNDIEVIVANDGYSPIEFPEYPYKIKHYPGEHKGVSATRNRALDLSTGDYVMFCDIDDMFSTIYGLRNILNTAALQPDVITSTFYEEQLQNGYKLIPHGTREIPDTTFIHGKVFKRSYLIDNNIRFKEELTIHEDSYFNFLAQVCTENKSFIGSPFYLWKWNDQSVVRKDPENFTLKTYQQLIDSRMALIDELKRRGMDDVAQIAIVKEVFDAYYDFQKPAYQAQKNESYSNRAMRAFRGFYKQHEKEYLGSSVQQKSEMMQICRQIACKNGLIVETETIKDFLKRVRTW